MKYLEYLLYLTIFLIPTYLVRFSIFGIPTNMLETLVGITFFLWIIKKIQTSSNFEHWNLEFTLPSQHSPVGRNWKLVIGNKNLPFGQNLVSRFARNWELSAGILLLFLGLVFGILISPDTQTSLGVLKSWFLVPLAFFIVARTVLVKEEQKEKALLSLALSGIGVALLGFFYWLSGNLTFDGRLAAFYESPNMLAMYIAPAILIVYQALNVKRKAKNAKQQFKIQNFRFFRFLVVVFSFALLVFSLISTRSLGALLSVSIVLLFILLYKAWGKRWGKLWITSIIIGIALISFILPFTSLFFNPWGMGRTSLASRLMIWQASAAMLKDDWLFGIGPGMFYETYLVYQKNFSPFLEWAVPHPHNIFLATWLYAGLLGLVGFLLILYWFFQKSSSTFYFLLSTFLMYLLIHGMIDNTIWRNDAAMIFWTILALAEPFVVGRKPAP